MPYDEFLRRLKAIGTNRNRFALAAGIKASTTYNWRRIGVPAWGQALLRQQETIATCRDAIRAISDLADQNRISEISTHARELAQCL